MENRRYNAVYQGYQIIFDIVDQGYWIYDKITHNPVEIASTIENAKEIIDNWRTDYRRLPTELLAVLKNSKEVLGHNAYLSAVNVAILLTGCSYETIDDQVKKYTLNLK